MSISAARGGEAGGVGDEQVNAPRGERDAERAAEDRQQRLSVSSCRSSRSRLAPSTDRIAISRSRRTIRASVRLATLAHTMSSTNPAVPSRTSSVVLKSRVISSLSGVAADSVAITGAIDVGMLRLQSRRDHVEIRARLLDRDARLHTREGVHHARGRGCR